MSDKIESKKDKNYAVKYPVIYSYIYERESQDINRLAGKFRSSRNLSVKKTSTNQSISGFRIENGIATPIYSESNEWKKKLRSHSIKNIPNTKGVLRNSASATKAVKTIKKDKS
ncbi:hypothetical protein PQG22_09430 [Aquirufa beregesia]